MTRWPIAIALLSACASGTAPEVLSVEIGPLPADVTTVLEAHAELSAAGDASILWFVGARQVHEGPTLDGASFDRGDLVFARVVPRQDDAVGPAVDSDVVSIANAAPTVGSITLTPAVPTAIEPLHATALDVVDADGDPVTVAMRWLVDGVQVATGDTVGGLVGGQRVVAEAVASDGFVEGPAQRVEVVVANTAPVLLDATIEPAAPRSSDPLTAVVPVDDPDNDTVTVTVDWFVEGAWVATGDVLAPGSAHSGQTVHFVATPHDGQVDGDQVQSAEVVLDNGLPVLTQVRVTPSTVRTADVATCVPTVREADGDPVTLTFAWTVNGVPVSSEPTLDGVTAFDVGDVLQCRVVGDDGIEEGLAVLSDLVVVADSPPTRPRSALVPPDPHADETVRCDLTEGSTDRDGDEITYAVSWEVDGLPYTGPTDQTQAPGDTLPRGTLDYGQTWSCTISAVTDAATTDSLPAERQVPAARLENVLIVVLDDVGVDKVPSYGGYPQQPVIPVIDGLAAAGMRFERAWSTPVCSPSRSNILTGRHGRRTGLGATVDNRDSHYDLPTEEVVLPEALRRSPAPYATAMFGKWHLYYYRGLDWPSLVYMQGFDVFAGTRANIGASVLNLPTSSGDTGLGTYRPRTSTGDTADAGPVRGYYLYEKYEPDRLYWETNFATTETIDDVLAMVPALTEPWFVQVSLHANHEPLSAPPAGLSTLQVDDDSPTWELFNANLEAADTEIGRMLDGLGASLISRTNVIVVGDNGSPSDAIRAPFDDSFGKSSIRELGIHVPLIVAGPAVAQPGSTSDALVHTVDLFTTVADIAGVRVSTLTWEDGAPATGGDTSADTGADTGAPSAYTGPVAIDGLSLLPFLADPDTSPRREYVYTERFSPNGGGPYTLKDQRAVRGERYKLVREIDGRERLYDIDPTVPNESDDLLSSGEPLTTRQQEAYDGLHAAMDGFIADLVYDHD